MRLVVPREHGAWAMLLLPYVTGFLIAGRTEGAWLRMLAGLAGILMLFMARYPAMRLAKMRYRGKAGGRNRRDYRISTAIYLAAAAPLFLLSTRIDEPRRLAPLAVIVVIAALLQSWLALSRGDRSVAAEMTGVLLLTLTAPFGVIIAGSESEWVRLSVSLWAMNAAFYGASVFNVKMKVASMVGRRDHYSWRERLGIARGSIIYTLVTASSLVLASGTGIVPPLAFLSFLPLVIYLAWNIAVMSSGLKIKTEGVVQLVMSLVFTVIVVIAWGVW